MWFSSWLRNRTVSHKRRPARRFQPALEVLEDRAVPAMFKVTTILDGVVGSLRQAVIDANASPGADTIHLPAGHYRLSLAGADEDQTATGDLDITGNLTIQGAGAGTTTIDAAGLGRAFHVLGSADVTLSGLTVRGGSGESYYMLPYGEYLIVGGGILNEGALTVRNSALDCNSAEGDGYGFGGGIANFGLLTIRDSSLTANTAVSGGGIYNASYYDYTGIVDSGMVTVLNCNLSDNSALFGGGIACEYGTVVVRGSVFSHNSAGNGGGIFIGAGVGTVRDSTLQCNTAIGFGGGIDNRGALMVANCTLSGNAAEYGGGVLNADSSTLTNSTLSGNYADYGGGIGNYFGVMTIRDSTLSGNSAIAGGGIWNYFSFGDSYVPPGVTVRDCTLSGNSADYGGAIWTFGTLTVKGSTLVGNSAIQGGAIYNAALHSYGDFYGTVTVHDSLFSGNTATDFGGGIANFGTLTVRQSTLVGNTALLGLGGDLYNAHAAFLYDSVIADWYG